MASSISPLGPGAAPLGTGQVGTRQKSERPAGDGSSATDARADLEALASAAERANGQVILGGRTIEFKFDDEVGRVVVTVKTSDSGEIVRQIPPEEYMRFLAQFNEMLGVLFDEKA